MKDLIIDNRQKYEEKKKELTIIYVMLFAIVVVCSIYITKTIGWHDAWFMLLFLVLMPVYHSMVMAYWSYEVVVSEKGVRQVFYKASKADVFVPWEEMERISATKDTGKYSTGDFFIVCRHRVKTQLKNIYIAYTPELYKQFLAYVPEANKSKIPDRTEKFYKDWEKYTKKKGKKK